MRRASTCLLPLLFAFACAKGEDSAADGPSFQYPRDGELRMGQLQALGTHNSYHVETEGTPIEEWQYSHQPLDVQAGDFGVRQFELDVNWVEETGAFEVYHVPLLDAETTCATLADCLSTLMGWSADHPGHHPMMVLLETKTEPTGAASLEAMLQDLDDAVLSAVPVDQLLTPDRMQGSAESVAVALSSGTAPTLGALRGRTMFVLHSSETVRALYSDDFTQTAGRPLWPHCEGDTTLPACGLHVLNDAIGEADLIAATVAAGHIVRTRTDGDGVEARANDYTVAEAAFASGAQFVSTDFPSPHPDTGYVVQIPGGTPSRCNPLTAPADCVSTDIESPDELN